METKDFSEIRSTELVQKNGLTILAGCPASGKTTYALKLAKEFAIDFSLAFINTQIIIYSHIRCKCTKKQKKYHHNKWRHC